MMGNYYTTTGCFNVSFLCYNDPAAGGSWLMADGYVICALLARTEVFQCFTFIILIYI